MLSVSLVIPAWNEAERIEDCLTCCVRQTMPAKEIIVVDNKSTDNTRQIVQRFIDTHPEAHIILMEQLIALVIVERHRGIAGILVGKPYFLINVVIGSVVHALKASEALDGVVIEGILEIQSA